MPSLASADEAVLRFLEATWSKINWFSDGKRLSGPMVIPLYSRTGTAGNNGLLRPNGSRSMSPQEGHDSVPLPLTYSTPLVWSLHSPTTPMGYIPVKHGKQNFPLTDGDHGTCQTHAPGPFL